MKKFSLRIFLISTVLVGVLVFGSFLAAFSEVGGTQKSSIFLSFFAKTIHVFGFPVITAFSRMDIELGYPLFFAALIINSLLYGLLTERIISLIRKKSKVAHVRTGK